IELEYAITLARLRVEANTVAQARASTALHADTQTTLFRGHTFFRHRRTNSGDGLLAHLNALCRGGLRRLSSNRGHNPISLRRRFRASTQPASSSSRRSRRVLRLPQAPNSESSPEAARAPSRSRYS